MDATKETIRTIARLKKRADFLCVQKSGTKWVAKGMVVELLNADGQESLRYGVTVSKRCSKLAVTRNRIKRRLRAVACDVLPAYAAAGKRFDIVLIGRVESERRDYQDLKQDLVWCLDKLGIKK